MADPETTRGKDVVGAPYAANFVALLHSESPPNCRVSALGWRPSRRRIGEDWTSRDGRAYRLCLGDVDQTPLPGRAFAGF